MPYSGKLRSLGLTLLLLAGAAAVPFITDINEGRIMSSGDTKTQNSLLPPIDTWVPEATGTATFSLG